MRPLFSYVLSKLTGFKEDDILNAEFIGGELPKDNIKQKGQIADIIINLDKKRCIVVEINQKHDPALISKNGYYAMKVALSKRTKKIPEPEVWLVNIDKFLLKTIVNIPQYFKVLDEDFGTVSEFPGYHSVHLPIDYIIGNRYNEDEKLYQFAQIFSATTLEEVYEICKGDDELMSVYGKIKELTDDPMFLVYYNAEEEEEIYRENSKRYALEQGHKEGLEQGLEEGLEQGLEQGFEQGRQEERSYIVYNMISNGMKREDISKYTNIPIGLIKEMEKRKNPYANIS